MTVEPQNMPIIGVVVMPNMLDTVVHEVYDLKGSTYGRFTKEKDKEKGIANVVQKDLDVKFHLYVPNEMAEHIREQIDSDCRFLESMRIMDYSLLLGMQRLPEGTYYLDEEGWPKIFEEEEEEEEQEPNQSATTTKQFRNRFQKDIGGVCCLKVVEDSQGNKVTVEPVIALFGIIDILQTYDPAKCSEHWLKRLWIDPKAVSVTNPESYADRFQSSMGTLFVGCDEPPELRLDSENQRLIVATNSNLQKKGARSRRPSEANLPTVTPNRPRSMTEPGSPPGDDAVRASLGESIPVVIEGDEVAAGVGVNVELGETGPAHLV